MRQYTKRTFALLGKAIRLHSEALGHIETCPDCDKFWCERGYLLTLDRDVAQAEFLKAAFASKRLRPTD